MNEKIHETSALVIQIDGRFPSKHHAEQLVELIRVGWRIVDKTVVGGRYVNYILMKGDPDVGKTNESSNQPT